MIIGGNQKIKPIENVNKELLKILGDLDEKTAKITLAKFLRYNLSFTSSLILGIDLEPFQTMHLNAMFRKNNVMLIFARGGSKSTLAGWYIILKCIFEPGTRVVIASANFRTSRRIFEEIEKLLNTEGALLARQCFDVKPVKRNDAFTWGINGGQISAIPLSEDTRGFRGDLLVLDETLLLPPQIINEVLVPFLSSPRDAAFRIKVRKLEESLIKTGALHPNNRMMFENCAQMLCLSSASYHFQHLYKMYNNWCEFIEDPKKMIVEKNEDGDAYLDEERPTYFVSQLSWEAIPSTIINRSFIESQKSSISDDSFQREFGAQFRDGGDGYYSMKKMYLCTIPDGEFPHSKVKGDPLKKYILSIDPNYSKAQNADYFAMAVVEIDEEKQEGILVHGYQRVAVDTQDHVRYMYYLMSNFNIVLIVADAANIDTFFDAVNENELFKSNLKKKITYIQNWDSTKEGEDHLKMLEESMKEYNVDLGCMCIRQTSTSDFIMRANSYLQSCIDHKKIWFASRASNHPDYIHAMFSMSLPLDLIFPKNVQIDADTKEESRKLGIRDFVELQDFIMEDTKKQCANVEVTQTSRGVQSFDLPRSARTSSSSNKARKDNYTTLLLGNWGIKCYFDLVKTPILVKKFNFVAEIY